MSSTVCDSSNHSKVIAKSHQNHSKIIPESYQNHSITLPYTVYSILCNSLFCNMIQTYHSMQPLIFALRLQHVYIPALSEVYGLWEEVSRGENKKNDKNYLGWRKQRKDGCQSPAWVASLGIVGAHRCGGVCQQFEPFTKYRSQSPERHRRGMSVASTIITQSIRDMPGSDKYVKEHFLL